MKIDITYPQPGKEQALRRHFIAALRWPFLFAAFICPVINLVVGGKAWSAVVVWSLWMVWSGAVSPSLVEYNRISQSIKSIVNACVLLFLIDWLLAPGWAIETVPIVCFSGLAASGVLFFTDLQRQKQNMFPMMLLTVGSLLGSVIGLSLWHQETRWAMAVMGAVAFSLLVGCAATLGPDFLRDVKKRFHTK